jgi:hypothetical protein
MPTKNLPHPRSRVRSVCLEPLRLSISHVAKILGVTREADLRAFEFRLTNGTPVRTTVRPLLDFPQPFLIQ